MIHNVENWVTLSQHFHSKIASEITVREHSPKEIVKALHYHYQETRYGYAQVFTVVTGYRPQRV
jgi:nitrogen regulatory protein PII